MKYRNFYLYNRSNYACRKKSCRLICAVALFLFFNISLFGQANILKFRSGKILGTELYLDKSKPPQIKNENQYEESLKQKDPEYVMVQVQLEAGRSLSIYDYVLKGGRAIEYPCVAIKEKGDVYDVSKWQVEDSKGDKKLTMLFRTQPAKFGSNPKFSLSCKLMKIPDIPLKITKTITEKKPPPTKKPDDTKKPDNTKQPDTNASKSAGLAEIIRKVPQAKDFKIVYSLDLKKLKGDIKYDVDNSNKLKKQKYENVGYFLELQKKGKPLEWIFVVTGAYTSDIKKIGIPHAKANSEHQKPIQNLKVYTNVKGVPTGEKMKGNIEFWPYNYSQPNEKKVKGASDKTFDMGDKMAKGNKNGYGSMQLHSANPAKVLFAINKWSAGNNADIGIGNNPSGNPDWTHTKSGAQYSHKKLFVLIKPAK